MALYQNSPLPLTSSARIHNLLFLPYTRCCNLFRKLVSFYLIISKLTEQHSQTLDPILGQTERTWSSVNHNVARPIVSESLEKSECNIPTDSQHANQTRSIGDLDDLSSKGKEKAIPQDQTEDVAHKDTPTSIQTRSFEELLELLRELRERNAQGNLHSSPQYGAGSFGQPHTIPTPEASHSSDGTLPLRPECKIPSAYVTKVYHHYHYHYNAPNVSPLPIINTNIIRINNNNTSNSSEDSESGDDEGEH